MRLANTDVLFAWPLDLHVLTQGWYYNGGTLHSAIDLRTNQNGDTTKPVYASEDGVVDYTQIWDGKTRTGMQSYGTMIRIKHANYYGKSLQTRYAHLSKILVKYGQSVKEGQLIGYTGETGNIFGAHLHYEVIYNGWRSNPLVWLDNDFTRATGKEYTYGKGEVAVVRPTTTSTPAVEPTPEPAAPVLKTVTIKDISVGDVKNFEDLAKELKLESHYSVT